MMYGQAGRVAVVRGSDHGCICICIRILVALARETAPPTTRRRGGAVFMYLCIQPRTPHIPPTYTPLTQQPTQGKGVPRLGQAGIRGDQVVNVVVNFPTKLSTKERELLERLRSVQGGASSASASASAASVGATAAGGEGSGGGGAGGASSGAAEAKKKKKGGGFFGGFGRD